MKLEKKSLAHAALLGRLFEFSATSTIMKKQFRIAVVILLFVPRIQAEDCFIDVSSGHHQLSGGVSIEIKAAAEVGKSTYVFTGPKIMPDSGSSNAGHDPNFASFEVVDPSQPGDRILFWEAEKGVIWWTEGDSLRASDSTKYGFPTRTRTIDESKTDVLVPAKLRVKLR